MHRRYRAFPLLYPVVIASVIVIVTCFLSIYPAESGTGTDPLITANAAILMDAGTGQVLFERNSNIKKPPASTTKIMTAILALEGGELQDTVTVSPNAASVGEASLELQQGEILTLQHLLYGALLESGNDACVALAEHIGGTEANFLLLMNHKAKLIGADSTSFKNTNGLPAVGHYSTAKDLATITCYALRNPVFRQIVGTKDIIIESSTRTRHLNNTNKLLWSYYGAEGVKTGTTLEAGCCLVASATREDRELISVVLNSDNRWKDSMLLLDYGFNRFEKKRVINQEEVAGNIRVEEGIIDEIKAVAAEDLDVVIPNGKEGILEKIVFIERQITAPVVKGQSIGRITVRLEGEVVGSVELVSDRDVDKMPKYRLFMENGLF